MKIINPGQRFDEEKRSRVFWKRPGFWVILLLLAAASFFYRDSWNEIWEGIRQLTRRQLMCCILLSVMAYLLEGMTIAAMMGTVTSSFPVKKGIIVAYLCEFYRLITLGNGSGFAEIYYLHQSGIETGTATVVTMLQYICKRIAIMLLGGLSFVMLLSGHDTHTLCREYAGFMAVGCAVSLGVIGVFMCITLSERIAALICGAADRLTVKWPSKEEWLQDWKKQLVLLNRSGKDILEQKGKIVAAILLQTGKLLLFYAIPAYLLRNSSISSGAAPDWYKCMLLMAVVYMLSGVIPAPSGAGSLEFVFLLFFSRLAGTQVTVPAILVFRFATWMIPFLIGGVLYIGTKMQSGS